MKRDRSEIYALLTLIDSKRDEGGGAIFTDEYFDDPNHKDVQHFLPLLIEAGFVSENQMPSDYPEIKSYRITWKGHCYIDTYNIMAKSYGPGSIGNSLEMFISDLFLASLH